MEEAVRSIIVTGGNCRGGGVNPPDKFSQGKLSKEIFGMEIIQVGIQGRGLFGWNWLGVAGHAYDQLGHCPVRLRKY